MCRPPKPAASQASPHAGRCRQGQRANDHEADAHERHRTDRERARRDDGGAVGQEPQPRQQRHGALGNRAAVSAAAAPMGGRKLNRNLRPGPVLRGTRARRAFSASVTAAIIVASTAASQPHCQPACGRRLN
jgi:hypothetical protein